MDTVIVVDRLFWTKNIRNFSTTNILCRSKYPLSYNSQGWLYASERQEVSESQRGMSTKWTGGFSRKQ